MSLNIDSSLFSKIFQKADQGFNHYLTSTTSSVVSAITPAAITLLSIYVMLWGWSMLRGVISEPIMDGVTRIVRLSVICGIALSAGFYSGYVSDWLWSTPDAIANVIAGRDTPSSITFLDNLLGRFFTLGSKFMTAASQEATMGIPDLQLFFAAISILLIGIVVTSYTAFLFILSKMALAVLLSVGPIFIFLSTFEATKKFCDSWIGQVLNYVFLIMLTAACVKLILVFIEHYFVVMINAEPNIGDAIQLVGIALIGILVLIQTPSIASSLGGGVAISTLGGMGWALQKIKKTGNSTVKLLNGETLADRRAAKKRRADLARWAARNKN